MNQLNHAIPNAHLHNSLNSNPGHTLQFNLIVCTCLAFIICLASCSKQSDNTGANVFTDDASDTEPADNLSPVANAGVSLLTLTGQTITLDGQDSSDPNGDELSYQWALLSSPVNSNAQIIAADTIQPQFSADIIGDYQLALVVNDGFRDSKAHAITVRAISAQMAIKPRGAYTSSLGGNSLDHIQVRGGLVRAPWDDIEPLPGIFDFSKIANDVALIKAAGKHWSLAVAAGPHTPSWLIDQYQVPFINYDWQGSSWRLPLAWVPVVQRRLHLLAHALAFEFGEDPDLKLIYVSQFTQNGIEGQLPRSAETEILATGWTEDLWVNAVTTIARDYAHAFPNKALAVEVHENFNSNSASRIINNLWQDASLEQRVGAGMWWISGRTSYQPDLIDVLKIFPGDIYGQVIGRSDSTDQFPNGYPAVFDQAIELGLRYIEPWEYEFKNNTYDSVIADFNTYADNLP